MTIFSKIIKGEIPAQIIAEDAHFMAFLDIMPLVHGHVLVIPKAEVDYIFDLDDDLYQGLHLFAKKVAHAIKIAFPCKKVGVAVIGLEVPHVHIHLIPMNLVSDLNFSKEKLKLSPEELQLDADKLRAVI